MAEESLEAQQRKINDAWWDLRHPINEVAVDVSSWVVETFEDHVIVDEGSSMFKVPFTEADDVITFAPRAEWEEVEKIVEFVAKSLKAHAAAIKRLELEKDTQVYFGGAIKATQLDDGSVKLGGYLVQYGDPQTTDLYGEYFTPETDFGDATKSTTYFNHRLPIQFGDVKAKAYRKSLGDADLSKDDAGVWAEVVLEVRNEYEKMIAKMGLAGKLGWSSGTAPHLADKKNVKGAKEITKWALGLDASLTPMTAEPRNSVIPLKSLMSVNSEDSETDKAEAGDQPAADAIKPKSVKNLSKGKLAMYKTKEEALKAFADANGVEVADMNAKQIKYALTGTDWEGEVPPAPSISEVQIAEIAAKAAAETVKAMQAAAPGLDPDLSNVDVTKDAGDQPWKNDGEFFMAVKAAGMAGQIVDERLLAVKAPTGIGESVPSDGGFLVSSTIEGGIRSNMWSTGEILSRTNIKPVGANANGTTFNAVDETSRAAGSRTGGILGYWVGEGSTITNTKPTFQQVDLKLKKVAALVFATDEQLMDSTNLAAWLNDKVPAELAFMTEDAIYEGNGVGKPLGIMNSNALVSVTRINASTITPRDISNMWSRRYVGVNDYVWFLNQDVHPVLDVMTLTNEVLQPPGLFADSPLGRLLGRPMIDVEYASTLGTTGDIMLASMSQYEAIDKGGVQGAESIHVAFDSDQTVFRFTYRVDGEPAWASPVTPFKGTNTVSPFVVLSTSS